MRIVDLLYLAYEVSGSIALATTGVEIAGLTKRYSDVVVVDNLDLAVVLVSSAAILVLGVVLFSRRSRLPTTRTRS